MSDVTLVNAVLPCSVTATPLGILCLAASIEQAGYEVDVRDYQLCSSENAALPLTFAHFVNTDSPIIGIGCMSYALPLVIEAVEAIKDRNPDCHIVLGGIGPSGVAAELLKFSPAVDVVVLGEGEATIVELTGCLLSKKDLSAVAGIAYRENGQVRVNRQRPRILSLESLPRPAYSKVNVRDYRVVDVQFGRGCPFGCSFCDIAPYWSRKHTKRPVNAFVDELASLARQGDVHDVFFVDDTFVLSRQLVDEICDEITDRGIRIRWGCYARTDLVSEKLLAKMASAGCQKIFYGVESGSDAILDAINKGVSRRRTDTAIRASLDYIPFVTTSFVWGFPNESFEDLEETVAFLLYYTALGASPQFNLVLPYSYSELFRKYSNDLKFDPTFSSQLKFYRPYQEHFFEMIRANVKLFSAFYSLPTLDFDRKWHFLKEVGLDPHLLQDAYFEWLA